MTKYDIPALLAEVDAKFADATARGKTFTKLSVTKDKIIEMRKWEQAVKLIEPNFDRVLTDLKITYVPRQIRPGPMVVFPIMDVDGEFNYAQTKPVEGSEFYSESKKYYYLGTEPIGPRWLGNDPETIRKILKTRSVVVVEGPYDFLACRLVAPDVPVMCPLSKTLGPKHIAYLRLLGVRHLAFMLDNEDSGVGQKAMAYQSRQVQKLPNVRTSILLVKATGGGDPSLCLQTQEGARKLKSQLTSCFLIH